MLSEVKILEPDLSTHFLIPLFTSQVSAGFPSPADDYLEGKLDLNEHLIKKPAATIFVKVKGDSMVGAGIHNGDLIIVDRSIKPSHKSIVVATLNGEFTLKRLFLSGTKKILKAENPKYRDQEITNESDFEIWGVVTFVIHQAR